MKLKKLNKNTYRAIEDNKEIGTATIIKDGNALKLYTFIVSEYRGEGKAIVLTDLILAKLKKEHVKNVYFDTYDEEAVTYLQNRYNAKLETTKDTDYGTLHTLQLN